jgi:hypothetical protein
VSIPTCHILSNLYDVVFRMLTSHSVDHHLDKGVPEEVPHLQSRPRHG